MKSFKNYLNEKQVTYNNGSKYGQIVFLAGGAGSGKGFATKFYIDSASFKTIDVDEMKKAFLKLDSVKAKYPQIKDYDLRNPIDVKSLHELIQGIGLRMSIIDNLILGMKERSTLPNLLFDITMKNFNNVDDVLPKLLAAGYSPENVHITWVLSNYQVALVRNKDRERVVPDDILLQTHSGVAITMAEILKGRIPRGVNGSITVILNNPEAATFYTNDKKVPVAVKDFPYLLIKKPGEGIMPDKVIKNQLLNWVLANVPITSDIRKAYDTI